MYVEFYNQLFIFTVICFLLSFVKSDSFDARVVTTLCSTILFACLAFGAFGIEKWTPAGDEVVIYSPTYAYVCMFMGILCVTRLIIIVAGMITTDKQEMESKYTGEYDG